MCLTATAWANVGGSSSAVTDGERAVLNSAIEKWAEFESMDYSFTFQNLCNCAPGSTAKMRLEIRDNTINSIEYVEDVYEHHFIDGTHRYVPIQKKGTKVPEEYADRLVPIGPFLQEIHRVISQPLREYDAEFDSRNPHGCAVRGLLALAVTRQ